MIHRDLYKVPTKPSRVRVTSATGGQATGNVSQWLDDVTPIDATPGYQSDFLSDYITPLQAYARFEQIAQQYPDIAQIVPFPNKTNGYQRKAQATIGGTGQSAVVVSSAAWGHEGGNGITVEFVNRPGSGPAAGGRGHRQGGPRPAGQERDRRAHVAPRRRSRRRSRRARRA